MDIILGYALTIVMGAVIYYLGVYGFKKPTFNFINNKKMK